MTVPAFVTTRAGSDHHRVILALIVLGIVSFFRMTARGARCLAAGRMTGTDRHTRDVDRRALRAGLDPEAVLERALDARVQRVQAVQRERLD